jgi:large subunit ribosomal protein L31
MKAKIHPDYVECNVVCACGCEFTTRATKDAIKVEICSECHPFYTGKQKIVDTEGRVDRFRQRQKLSEARQAEADARTKKKTVSEKPEPVSASK